ncbi:Gp37-like protein, partial [Paraburkholderia sp. SIMBA_027]|uniref:Gp37-like protein n=1 Tax=Paraburkholderia sp. SIMBA_027 TaxID=3085770 RepID=UPI00397D1019
MIDNNPEKVGIIRSREIGLDESGKQSETWIITGETLNGVTKQRIAIAPAGQLHDTATGTAETVLKHFVNNHLVNPTEVSRKIPLVTLAPDLLRGNEVTFESKHMQLNNVLEEVSKLTGVGWKVSL